MKVRCCRSLPRCAECPVVLAACARKGPQHATAQAFALVRAAPPRELPACVLDALEGLDERRFTRGGGD